MDEPLSTGKQYHVGLVYEIMKEVRELMADSRAPAMFSDLKHQWGDEVVEDHLLELIKGGCLPQPLPPADPRYAKSTQVLKAKLQSSGHRTLQFGLPKVMTSQGKHLLEFLETLDSNGRLAAVEELGPFESYDELYSKVMDALKAMVAAPQGQVPNM